VKSLHLVAAALIAAPTLAAAQTAPAPSPGTTPAPATTGAAPATGAAPTAGATVYDAQGGTVGTIASVDATSAVIDTGTNKVAVQLSSIGTSPKGPTLGLTKVQLDAAATQQRNQAMTTFKTQLVPGAQVYGANGTALGTIKAADAQYVTVTTAKGDAKLPIAGFGPGAKGVTIGMTAEQLNAAISGSTATPPSGK